jgi:hypothetical protein
MYKKVMILGVLFTILIVLVLVRAHSISPVNTNTENDGFVEYMTKEYRITNMKGRLYYAKGENGTEISFSAKKIDSGDKIQVDDKVLIFFEKNNMGKGVIKVEKK